MGDLLLFIAYLIIRFLLKNSILFVIKLGDFCGIEGSAGSSMRIRKLLRILARYEQSFGIELDLQVSGWREIEVLDQTKPNMVILIPKSDAHIDLI